MAGKSKLLPTAAEIERLKRAGRGPDTELIHAMPSELRLLKAHGGSGTINPRTGLPEFFGNEGGGGGYSGSRETRTSGSPGRSGNTGGKDPHPGFDRLNQPKDENPQLKDWAAATEKYQARGWGRRALDFLAGSWMDDQAPDFNDPRTYWDGDYHTSWNPAGALTGVGMMAAGPLAPLGPIASRIVAAITPDVYHKDMPADSPTAHAARSYEMSPGGMAAGASSGTGTDSGPSPSNGHSDSIGPGASLLPPIAGNPAVPHPVLPGAPAGTPPGGSGLPPINPPQQPGATPYPGGYMPVQGPSPYGWTRPTWMM